MSTKTKGRFGGSRAAYASVQFKSYFTTLASITKDVLVTLTVWGVIPASLAFWVINLQIFRGRK